MYCQMKFCVLTTLFVLICIVRGHANLCVKSDEISVRGNGRVSVQTTIAEVRLGLDVLGKTANVVQRMTAMKTKMVVRYLRQEKVKKLQTRGISLIATSSYRPKSKKQFRGQNSVSFEVSVEKVGKILDGSVMKGANRIERVSFRARRGILKRARKVALKMAVRAARRDANAVADAAGLTYGKALNVRIMDSFSPSPVFGTQFFQANSLGRRPAPIGFKNEQAVSASISVVYEAH